MNLLAKRQVAEPAGSSRYIKMKKLLFLFAFLPAFLLADGTEIEGDATIDSGSLILKSGAKTGTISLDTTNSELDVSTNVNVSGVIEAVTGDIGNIGLAGETITINTVLPGDGFIFKDPGGVEVAKWLKGTNLFNLWVSTAGSWPASGRMSFSTLPNENADITFNGNNSGFSLRESSVTFDSGSDDPILDWVTDGYLRVANGTFTVSEKLIVGTSTAHNLNVSQSGAAVFAGSKAGFVYTEISTVSNKTETAIAASDTPVQIVTFGANGDSLNATPDHTNDHITIVKPGCYFVAVSATINSGAGAASKFEMTVQKNNGNAEVGALHCNRNLAGGGGVAGVISMSGLAPGLVANDTIEVWIENETNTVNYVIEDITLTLFQVGG